MTDVELQPKKPFVHRLFQPVDCASLVMFRVALGLIFLWEVWRYMSTNWVSRYYIDPEYHFHYMGFSWIKPWGGDGMFIHFALMGMFAFFMAIGFLYRFSVVAHFLLFTFIYLLDQAKYLNHFYLVCLINFMLIWMPAHRAFSVDSILFPWLREKFGWKWLAPDVPSETVPAWTVWSLRWQLGLVYFFAAVAKMNADWMFHGEPIGDWLDGRGSYVLFWDALPVGDWVFDEPWAGMVFAWGGLMLDLLAWPLLTWRKTRIPMFLGLLFFHTMNKWLFNIGIFPVMAISASTIFFEPNWPRKICLFFAPKEVLVTAKDAVVGALSGMQRALVAGLAVYMAIQVLLPLRHFLYPGTVHWTEEGHRFAWHMKLRDKEGRATFYIHDPKSGVTWEMGYAQTTRSDRKTVMPKIRSGQRDILTPRQIRKMTTRPYMLHQFVQHLEQIFRDNGYEDVEIRVDNECRLNMRPWQRLIDPTVDLTEVKHTLWPKPWLLPLETPFRPVADDDDDDDAPEAVEPQQTTRTTRTTVVAPRTITDPQTGSTRVTKKGTPQSVNAPSGEELDRNKTLGRVDDD